MDEIDRLLANLESQPKSSEVPKTKSPEVPKTPAVPRPAQPTPSTQSIGALLTTIENNASKQSSPVPQPQTTRSSNPVEDTLLEQVKLQYQQHDQVELQRQKEFQEQAQRQRQAELQLKQQRLEQLKLQRRADLEKTASAWLKQLNPKSAEGRWFEEFACSYASPLEAAIDYLEALEEVDLQP